VKLQKTLQKETTNNIPIIFYHSSGNQSWTVHQYSVRNNAIICN